MLKFWPVTVFLLLVYCLNAGEGLRCYICRSDTDVNCTSENMSPTHSKVCPPNNGRAAIVCRKIHQQLTFKKEDKFTSIRECGYNMGHLSCYFFKHREFAIQETCECENDNCNRGSTYEPSDLMTVILFVFAVARFLNAILMNIA